MKQAIQNKIFLKDKNEVKRERTRVMTVAMAMVETIVETIKEIKDKHNIIKIIKNIPRKEEEVIL